MYSLILNKIERDTDVSTRKYSDYIEQMRKPDIGKLNDLIPNKSYIIIDRFFEWIDMHNDVIKSFIYMIRNYIERHGLKYLFDVDGVEKRFAYFLYIRSSSGSSNFGLIKYRTGDRWVYEEMRNEFDMMYAEHIQNIHYILKTKCLNEYNGNGIYDKVASGYDLYAFMMKYSTSDRYIFALLKDKEEELRKMEEEEAFTTDDYVYNSDEEQ
jgi:hypothetical protein